MAPKIEEEEEAQHRFIISSLGLGLGFLFITRSRTLKPLSTAIKLADEAIKIPKALAILHSPSSPQTLIVASKALIKGLKVSSRLIRVESHRRSSAHLSTRLKAYVAAINLIRFNRFVELGFVRGGYKLSKNFVRVIEGFVGLQLDSAVKQGIDALGLFVKASAIVREVAKFQKRRNGLRFCSRVRGRPGIFVQHKRFDLDGVCSSKHPPFRGKGVIVAKDLEVSLSDLLCLSVPIHEVIPPLLLYS